MRPLFTQRPFFVMELLDLGYLGLFIASFLAATIVPFSSEGLFLVMLLSDFDPISCLIIATLGNSLGGFVSYWIGYLGKLRWIQKLGVKEEKLQSFQRRVLKYGHWLAFLSWVPILGDPLTIALGYFKSNVKWTLLFLFIGKFLRYLIILLLTLYTR